MTHDQVQVRSLRRKKTRLLLGGILVLILLATGRFARQKVLDRRLAFAIINNRHKEAMGLLEQGADATALYYSPLPSDWWSPVTSDWWRRLIRTMKGERISTEGTPLLDVVLENRLSVEAPYEVLPPTPDRLALMTMLVKKGTPVNVAVFYDGTTPLEFAIVYGSYDLVKCLLDHGADVNMRGYAQESMIDYAIGQSDRRIFFLILNRNPDFRHENPNVWPTYSVHPEYLRFMKERYAQAHSSH